MLQTDHLPVKVLFNRVLELIAHLLNGLQCSGTLSHYGKFLLKLIVPCLCGLDPDLDGFRLFRCLFCRSRVSLYVGLLCTL